MVRILGPVAGIIMKIVILTAMTVITSLWMNFSDDFLVDVAILSTLDLTVIIMMAGGTLQDTHQATPNHIHRDTNRSLKVTPR